MPSPIRALTRAEAETRAGLVSVDGYTVHLDVTDPAAYRSATTVEFRCTAPGATTFAEVKGAELERVVLNGRPLDPASLDGNRLPLPDLRAANRLEVTFTAPYSHAGEGLHRTVDPQDGETYLYGQAPLDEAQRMFACFDQPDLKAPITLTVTAPAQWTVLGNAPLREARDGRWSFAPTPPLAPYLFTVLAGAWHVRTDGHDGVPLALVCRRSLAARLDAAAGELFAATAASLDRYHELFGVRYPFGKYDQAFVPDFAGGAVENPGMVNYREELLFQGTAPDHEHRRRFVIMAHELAHMWFGNLVTLRWWDDIWLNEAFAELMGWRVAADTGRHPGAAADFVVWRKRWGMLADQRPSTHPVAPDDVADTTAAFLNFDGISYAKGAAALRQLSVLLGDDVFLAGLRVYFERFRFGNATLADLLAVLAEVSTVDLTGWAPLWLRTAGVNTLRPAPGPAVHQSGTPLRPHRFRVAVYDRTGAPTHRAEVTLTAGSAGLDVPEGAVLLLNDGDDTYAKIRLDPPGLAALPSVLPAVADPLARAQLWTAAMDAAHDGELAPEEFLALLRAALPGEAETGVLLEVLGFARDSLARRGLVPFGPLEAACDAALAAAAPGSGRQLALATALTTVAGPAGAARLAGWLAPTPAGPPGLVVTQDLRWEVLGRLAALGYNDAPPANPAAPAANPTAAASPARGANPAGGEHNAQADPAGGEHNAGADPAANPAAASPAGGANPAAASPVGGANPAGGANAANHAVRGFDAVAAIADEERRDPSAAGAQHAVRCRAALPTAAAKAEAWELIVRDGRPRLAMAAAAGFWQPGQEALTDPYVERFFADAPAMVSGRYQLFAMNLVRQVFPRYTGRALELARRLLDTAGLDPVLRREVGDAADELRYFQDRVEAGRHRSTRW